jgi:hypothetical protein
MRTKAELQEQSDKLKYAMPLKQWHYYSFIDAILKDIESGNPKPIEMYEGWRDAINWYLQK